MASPSQTDRQQSPRALLSLGLLSLLAGWSLLTTGCGALPLAPEPDPGATTFADGELWVTEEVSLEDLHAACGSALETLRYTDLVSDREADRGQWRAKTASGSPVGIRLIARGPRRTELRIRVGRRGNETRSHLVLEQIRRSL